MSTFILVRGFGYVKKTKNGIRVEFQPEPMKSPAAFSIACIALSFEWAKISARETGLCIITFNQMLLIS